ncbi:MAG: hypothetical protein P9M03_05535, partial [Candidatus Theseobacter exili]|nr:hypothetical protein [Candidatus Theseobacter exili]
ANIKHETMLISRIQKDLFDFIELDPDDRDGLIEYWYMSNSEALSAALTEKQGHNIIVNVSSFDHFEMLSKKLFLLADTLVLRDTRKWTKEENKFNAIPIPIKGYKLEYAVKNSKSNKIPIPIEDYKPGYSDDVYDKLKDLKPSPLTFVYKPNLYWTSTEKTLNNGYHVAYAGWEYNNIPAEFKNWISNSGREFLKTGRIVYAPFIPSLEMELEFLKNKVSLPEYFNATPFYHQNYEWLNDNNLNVLLSIKFPYLDNLNIDTISKVKEDHHDDFSNFSKSLLSAINNVKSTFGTNEFLREVKYIQRNQIDDSLDKIEQKVKRICNMSVLSKAGVLMGLIGLNASMYLGADMKSIVTGLTAAGIAVVLDKVNDMKAEGQLKENDCYFLWKLKEYTK